MPSLKWPNPSLFVSGYLILLIAFSVVMIALDLPLPALISMAAPIFLAAFHYPQRLYLIMLPLLILASSVFAIFHPEDLSYSLTGNVIGLATAAVVAEAFYHLTIAREKAEQTLRNSEAAHRAIIENSPLGISVRNRTGQLLSYNPAWKKIWAMPDDAILGDLTRERKELVFDHRDQYLQPQLNEVERVYRQGGNTYLPELKTTVARPGAAEWVSQHFYAITNQNGDVDRVVILTEDITDRKLAEQAEREQRAMAEALRDTAAALNSTLDFEEVIERILINVGRVVPHDAVNVMLVKEGIASVIRAHGYEGGELSNEMQNVHVKLDEIPLLQYIAETGSPVFVPDTRADPRWRVIAKTDWVRSYAGAPILARGKLVGFLNLDSATPGFFNIVHAERLATFADQAAIAVENARLYAEVQEQVSEIATLYRASSNLLNPASDLTSLAEYITQLATQEFGVMDCGVLLLDESGARLNRVARSGSFQIDGDTVIPVDSPGLIGVAARTGKMVYAPDVSADPRYLPNHTETRSELDVPLIAMGRVIGVLNLQSPQLDAFDERVRRIVTAFAESASLALENARLTDKLQQLAIMDELTNIYNYRGLFELGQREIERARRFNRPLTALFCDIDLFREFNKKYTHAIGNQVLRAVADRSRSSVRSVDLVARYGGEEFVILLPETDLYTALPIAERLLKDIEATVIPTKYGDLGVKVSIGVAELRPDMPDLAALIDRADQAEHRAKEKGRNRVEFLET